MPAPVIDHVSDVNGVELARFAAKYDFPDFVKKADMAATMQPERLALTIYADPANRRFPCHTAASTWLSALYFQEKKAALQPALAEVVSRRIDDYTRYWRIKEAVETVKAKHSQTVKSAEDQLPDTSFAWVWAGDNGYKERRLPLRNAIEVKTAAEWLHTYRASIPFRDRHVIATKIMEKKAEYGADLGVVGDYLARAAGMGTGNAAEINRALETRIRMARDPEDREQLSKIAAEVRTAMLKPLSQGELLKIAEVVDAVDHIVKVKPAANSTVLPYPEDLVFSDKPTMKSAAEDEKTVTMQTGRSYKMSEFDALSGSHIREFMGDEFAQEVAPFGTVNSEKLAVELAALPRPDAELADAMFEAAGVPGRKSAALFTNDEMHKLAEAYAKP